MVSKIRSQTNQTVDEVHQKRNEIANDRNWRLTAVRIVFFYASTSATLGIRFAYNSDSCQTPNFIIGYFSDIRHLTTLPLYCVHYRLLLGFRFDTRSDFWANTIFRPIGSEVCTRYTED